MSIRLRIMPGQDQRRYNLPTSDEVAAILPGDGTAPERRDIILRSHSDGHLLHELKMATQRILPYTTSYCFHMVIMAGIVIYIIVPSPARILRQTGIPVS